MGLPQFPELKSTVRNEVVVDDENTTVDDEWVVLDDLATQNELRVRRLQMWLAEHQTVFSDSTESDPN